MQYVDPLQAKCTLANATGARLELLYFAFLPAEYMPPKILEPGAVASFLIGKDFTLQYNIQVFQGPFLGWMRPDVKSVTLDSTTYRSGEIEADVQVAGDNPRGPPAMYPTKFIFDVYENGDLVQIFAKQLITQTPRG